MGRYANVSHVQARLPFPAISATSTPSTDDVDRWIAEAEGAVHGALRAAKVSTPVTDADGRQLIRYWVLQYAEGKTRIARASSGGDGTNDDGVAMVQAFDEQIQQILNNSARASAMVGGGSSDTAALRLRSHVTNHPDGQSTSAGDFDPKFNKLDGEDQW